MHRYNVDAYLILKHRVYKSYYKFMGQNLRDGCSNNVQIFSLPEINSLGYNRTEAYASLTKKCF